MSKHLQSIRIDVLKKGRGKQVMIFGLSLLIQSGLYRLGSLLLQNYPEILVREVLEETFKISEESEKSRIYKTIIPLYQLNEEISRKIKTKLDNEPNRDNKAKLIAFNDGFFGQSRPVELQPILLSFLIFIGVLLIACLIFEFSPMNIVEPVGGSILIFCPLVAFVVSLFSYKRLKEEESVISDIPESILEWSPEIDDSEIKKYLNKANLEELRDLGLGVRRYLQRIILNNADIDLHFIPSSVTENISALVKKSQLKADTLENQVTQLSEEVGKWFDSSMERASGVYKRNAKGISILIGFLLALMTNANSIDMIDRLAYDRELRQAVISSSERLISEVETVEKTSQGLTKDQIRQLNQDYADVLSDVNLPIGWNPALLAQQVGCEYREALQEQKAERLTWDRLFDICLQTSQVNKPKPKKYFIPTSLIVMFWTLHKFEVALLFIVGWLFTGIAISMGASFWFDLLGKLINVRNTGGKPSSPNQST